MKTLEAMAFNINEARYDNAFWRAVGGTAVLFAAGVTAYSIIRAIRGEFDLETGMVNAVALIASLPVVPALRESKRIVEAETNALELAKLEMHEYGFNYDDSDDRAHWDELTQSIDFTRLPTYDYSVDAYAYGCPDAQAEIL